MKYYLLAMVIGTIGGWFFNLIHMALPWTLGPLVSIALTKHFFKVKVKWPASIRNCAMLVLGYSMGRAFDPETGQRILALFPLLMVTTLITLALFLVGGLIIHKSTGLNLATSLFGSLPAGLSQTAMLCEEVKDLDLAAVTLMQTVRVLCVVFFVPLFSLHGVANPFKVATVVPVLGKSDYISFVFFVIVIGILTFLARYFNFPGVYIIPPLIGTAALSLWGLHAPQLPPVIISIAQICVGIRMGLSLNFNTLANWRKIVLSSLLNILGIILALGLFDYAIMKTASIHFLTAFIGTAPGGMAEMGLTAMMVNADLSTVVAFQLSRLLFVLLVVFPVLIWVFRSKESLRRRVESL